MKLKKNNAKKAGKMLIINVERCVVFAVIGAIAMQIVYAEGLFNAYMMIFTDLTSYEAVEWYFDCFERGLPTVYAIIIFAVIVGIIITVKAIMREIDKEEEGSKKEAC